MNELPYLKKDMLVIGNDALDIVVDIWENPDASIPWDRIQKLLEDINYETLND